MAEERPFNTEPHDMLATVPGVTPKNIMNLVLETQSIKDVANMTVAELDPMVGKEAGRKIHGFFNKDLIEDE